ncbi:uncharacterized protein LOC130527091 isoform X1 [Takifugu flavidus]|uniref:TIR domain-containing protein n=1 Tax=Takifugu flavidus TaxID=433684 RepID=A0A5C6MWZ0_9TELE|nr:uncharacterized protein LOC130527091 isoform X1 [Takifugu flavidus]TWW58838.1 hypothetical protein D4764_06G0003680 [Takifugu flavidus]
MPAHIMLSYQWDSQDLVKKIYDSLKDDGLPVWMDIEGGVTGNINDSMAAGVEAAAVICPFMTPAYQASRSCKKELNYADSREVIIVPVMLAEDWEASEWLGLITAGLLWVDFRNAEGDEQCFQMCLQSLVEEITFNAGHLLAREEPQRESVDHPEPPKLPVKKPGRGFRHALTKLYIHEADFTDEWPTERTGESRNTVELRETPGARSYWEEIKGNGCKYFRNAITHRYLSFDPVENRVYSDGSRSGSEEWQLLVDQTDTSHRRAVIIKSKRSELFLAVRNCQFIGLTSYTEDCKWLLD